MGCDVAKFSITNGVVNTFVFTIKADGSTLPIDITNGTFTATLVNLDTGDKVVGLTDVPLNKLTPYASGKVELVIDATEPDGITTLVSERGSKADRYYVKPTYKLILECVGTENGSFIAKVPEIYVD